MNYQRLFVAVVTTVALGLLSGCESTTDLTKRSQLVSLPSDTHVRILCADSTMYALEAVALRDTTVYGKGTVESGGMPRKFEGEIPLSNIQYIQSTQPDVFKTLLAIGTVGFVGFTAASYLAEGDGSLAMGMSSTWYDPRYTGGGRGGGRGGSCPYIYSWDGTQYSLEGEAYSVAWGKALELETVTVLPSLRPENGVLSVRFTNERPETHYYNAVSLEAVETGDETSVIADPAGVLWPVGRLQPPRTAVDCNGIDVLTSLKTVDSQYWESPLNDILPDSRFEDEIRVVLPKAAIARKGTLVIRAINTRIFDIVINKFSALLGKDYLTFVHELDGDPGLGAMVREWMIAASLKISLWNGGEWKPAGTVLPEGTAAPFTRGVRIHAGDLQADSVIVRLTCLTDVWKIDGVGVDWTPAEPLHPTEVPLLSAAGPDARDPLESLGKADARYVTVLPGQRIDCSFKAPKSSHQKQMSYALKVRGYLHEWPSATGPMEGQAIAASMTGASKIAYLKTLLRMRGILLPPIYAEWKENRSRFAR